ncbi:restriction endonuclease subunit S [Acidithiobacillus ferridurans]|uniref:Restriction endonuclease subunit S n=2 Tax=Acidithiobacillus ferridurans TaxID=1232575 RepID=A0A8X8GD82_ACIFI|nr:restriction endonuclease subunit S [Acidithiobacillus ferridurans]MBU2717621.1 restriction endonuclease subunit S [Acidithiobacillus ferridurans]MBU2724024.1 restriction endonuclease subunit S [Acidithiobacillus ferridurans]
MREGWEVKPLKEMCLIKPPKSEARKGQNADFLVSFAPMETLGIDQKYLITNQTRTMSDVVGSYTYFSNGDVLLAKITPCFENGKLGIASDLINNIGFGSSEYIVFRANEQLDAEWLYYYLSRQSFRNEGASRMAGAVGHKRITKDFIEDYPIPIPPLPEQRRIVAILDKAFEGIATAKANIEKNLQNAREIFESHLNAVFSQRGEGWVDRRLGDVAMEFGRGKSKHRPRNDPKLYGGSFPFIQTGDVRNSSHLITSYDQTYNDAGLAQSKLWPKGTLCITIAANIAETGILDFDACFPDSIIGLVANEKISTNKYIEYLLTSFKSRLQLLGKGSAQDNINLATFESQYFPFPPLSSQKEIVSIFDDLHEETQHLESIYQQKLAALDELKQSLLHQAFNGNL